MTERDEGLFLIGAMAVFSFVFQIQLKLYVKDLGALMNRQNVGWTDQVLQVIQSAIGWRPVLIVALAATLFIVYGMALMRLDLSLALSLAAVVLAINAIAGGFMLGEDMTMLRIVGTLVIVGGVVMVVRG